MLWCLYGRYFTSLSSELTMLSAYICIHWHRAYAHACASYLSRDICRWVSCNICCLSGVYIYMASLENLDSSYDLLLILWAQRLHYLAGRVSIHFVLWQNTPWTYTSFICICLLMTCLSKSFELMILEGFLMQWYEIFEDIVRISAFRETCMMPKTSCFLRQKCEFVYTNVHCL